MASKRIKEALGFDDIWVLLLGIPVLAFFIPLLFFNATLSNGLGGYLPKFLTSLMFTFAYWVSVRQILIFMHRRFPGHKQVRRRLTFTLVTILITFVVLHTTLNWVHHIWLSHEEDPVSELTYMVASLTIIFLVAAIYEGAYFYDRWRVSVIERERLERENEESQLAGLRNQVNPHFLFNSLNTLVWMIPEDPEKAVEFVRKLSKVYRYILEIRDRKLISLEEELRFLDAFIFLVKERFGENLVISLEVPERFYGAKVVPLSLQMLFENAIKHNVISSEHPLQIDLFVDEAGKLVVRNNLQLKHQEMTSTKVGLQNIKNRYAFFSEEPVQAGVEAGVFLVKLPLLHMPAEMIESPSN